MLDKTFNIAKNPKCDGYQIGLASTVYTFFEKKTAGGAATLSRSETLAERATRKNLLLKMKKCWTKNLLKNYLGCWSRWYAISKQI